MDPLRVRIEHELRSFHLEVELEVGRETVALAGPSGAGKTSVLRAIVGLLAPDGGRIECGGDVWFDSERNVDLPPEQRSVGLVFQEYALFPHMTVEQNVAYGGRARARELIDRLGLRDLAHVRPQSLSGGERQRVALARALARDPKVLLLDEPLAALDAQTRMSVRGELREHLRILRLPTVLVAHDYVDAAALADRIAVVVNGRIVQLGRAAELISAPVNQFVAEFTGSNLLAGRARAGAGRLTEVVLSDGTCLFSTDAAEGDVGVIVYPWEIAVARAASSDSAQNRVRGPITSLMPIGNRVRLQIGPLTAEITAASANRLGLRPGETVVASFKATGTRLVPLS
jgi:molybdate transport system ATP-binding protein